MINSDLKTTETKQTTVYINNNTVQANGII